jgi:hypothetical protein
LILPGQYASQHATADLWKKAGATDVFEFILLDLPEIFERQPNRSRFLRNGLADLERRDQSKRRRDWNGCMSDQFSQRK